MIAFKKISLNYNKQIIDETCRGNFLNEYGKIRYYKLAKTYQIFKPTLILRSKPDSVTWTEVTSAANLPHKDFNVKTNLNIYVDPAEGETRFYHIKKNAIPYSPNKEKFFPNLYHHCDLELIDTFLPNEFDAYLLNVSMVHEVFGVKDTNRKIIQFSWRNKSIEEISSVIEELFDQSNC